MAAFEVIALDTATPQLRAPGAADTYTFPRAVEMPLGTANGVLYLNGSKVVTSGSGLTFDGATLVLPSGNVSIGASASGRVLEIFNGDAVNLQRLRLTTSGTDGVIQVTRNSGTVPNLIFQQDASELMRLTGTGLGIGTSSPTAKLDVRGTFLSATTSGVANTSVVGGIAGASNGYEIIQDASDNLTYRWRSGSNVVLATLDASGNLGLGVTPAAWFGGYRAIQVGTFGALYSFSTNSGLMTNAYDDGVLKYSGTGFAQRYWHSTANGSHAWLIAPSGTAGNAISFTQAMTLDASGNLGIGTNNPGAKLEVLGAANSEYAKMGGGDTPTRSLRFSAFVVSGANNTGHLIDAPGASGVYGTLAFATNSTERIRIKSEGQLRYVPLAADPAGAENGDVYYNSSTNKLRLYAAGAWTDLN
jgi:hypothetical protein